MGRLWALMWACGGGSPPPPPAIAVPPVYRAERLMAPDGDIPSTGHLRRVGPGTFVLADPIRRRLYEVTLPGLASRPVPGDYGTPVRATRVDLDGTGAPGWLVADIGVLWPSDERVGRVRFGRDGRVQTLLDGVGRVVCAEPGDLDGDGDRDVAVCEFGHLRGGLRWLEQTRSGWVSHVLSTEAGWSSAWPADLDGDGDLDLAAAVSQTTERLVWWRNDGRGGFTEQPIADAAEAWYGTSGLEVVDLDGDGHLDLVACHGDTMDEDLPAGVDPDRYHGVDLWWNDGRGRFSRGAAASIWGAYATRAADLDGDGDRDLALASWQVPQRFPGRPTRPLSWIEQVAPRQFALHPIAEGPSQPVSVEAADVDGDGDTDLLAGTFYMNDDARLERLLLLRNVAGDPP